tara:strand:+ start:1872 stop:2126 length:255 start_codon:yes stop_codon:yes gene_type:complete
MIVINNETEKRLLLEAVDHHLRKTRDDIQVCAENLVLDKQNNGEEYWREKMEDLIHDQTAVVILLDRINKAKLKIPDIVEEGEL